MNREARGRQARGRSLDAVGRRQSLRHQGLAPEFSLVSNPERIGRIERRARSLSVHRDATPIPYIRNPIHFASDPDLMNADQYLSTIDSSENDQSIAATPPVNTVALPQPASSGRRTAIRRLFKALTPRSIAIAADRTINLPVHQRLPPAQREALAAQLHAAATAHAANVKTTQSYITNLEAEVARQSANIAGERRDTVSLIQDTEPNTREAPSYARVEVGRPVVQYPPQQDEVDPTPIAAAPVVLEDSDVPALSNLEVGSQEVFNTSSTDPDGLADLSLIDVEGAVGGLEASTGVAGGAAGIGPFGTDPLYPSPTEADETQYSIGGCVNKTNLPLIVSTPTRALVARSQLVLNIPPVARPRTRPVGKFPDLLTGNLQSVASSSVSENFEAHRCQREVVTESSLDIAENGVIYPVNFNAIADSRAQSDAVEVPTEAIDLPLNNRSQATPTVLRGEDEAREIALQASCLEHLVELLVAAGEKPDKNRLAELLGRTPGEVGEIRKKNLEDPARKQPPIDESPDGLNCTDSTEFLELAEKLYTATEQMTHHVTYTTPGQDAGLTGVTRMDNRMLVGTMHTQYAQGSSNALPGQNAYTSTPLQDFAAQGARSRNQLPPQLADHPAAHTQHFDGMQTRIIPNAMPDESRRHSREADFRNLAEGPEEGRPMWPKVREPSTFSAATHEDALEWVRSYETIASHNRWTEMMKATLLQRYLMGPPAKWWDLIKDNAPRFWQDQGETPGIRTLFLRAFQSLDFPGSLRTRLAERRLGENESVFNYCCDVLDLCKQISQDMSEADKITNIEKGLSQEIRSYMLEYRDLPTVEEYRDKLRLKVEGHRMRKIDRHYLPVRAAFPEAPPRPEPRQEPRPEADQTKHFQLILQQLRTLTDAIVHRQNEPRFNSSQGPRFNRPFNDNRRGFNQAARINAQPVCYHCQQPGHVIRHCPTRSEPPVAANPTKEADKTDTHLGVNCAFPVDDDGNEEEENETFLKVNCLFPNQRNHIRREEIARPDHGNLMVQPIMVNGHRVMAMMDSGSVLTIISLALASELQCRLRKWEGHNMRYMNDQVHTITGSTLLELEHPSGAKAIVCAPVVESTSPVLILGTDALTALKVTLTWDDQVPTVPGHPIVRGLRARDVEEQRRRFQLPPTSSQFSHCEGGREAVVGAVFGVETAIKGYPEETEDHFVGAVFACLGKEDRDINDNFQYEERDVVCDKVEAAEAENCPPTAATTLTEENESGVIGGRRAQQSPRQASAKGVSTVRGRRKNALKRAPLGPPEGWEAGRCPLTKRHELVTAEGGTSELMLVEPSTKDTLAEVDGAKVTVVATGHNFAERISASMPEEESKQLLDLLQQYQDTFARDSLELGNCPFTSHVIDTKDAKPIKQRAYPSGWQEQEKIRAHVDEMLAQDIIEPSVSPWSSPVLLVKKKDDSWRFCVDYRKLNAVTVKDVYPLPRIEDALARLNGAKVFSSLDLQAGYWQVPVAYADREKTAFITADGLWQFKVMPFGLCNAPGTFQRMMDQVLGDLRFSSCLVYLDDIIIYGKDFAEHQVRLEQVLRCLDSVGLKIKLKKCSFGEGRIGVLGHVVSAQGVEPDPAKIRAVKEFPKPPEKAADKAKKKHVMSFLGLCSYYRRFVPKFADIARPLHRLTHIDRPFEWSQEADESFDKLREALAACAALKFPVPNHPIEIHPDASDYGLGAVLVQRIDGVEAPIAYASRLLNQCERNYSITEKEGLAVLWALQKFKPYVWGEKITVITDHHGLCWLMLKHQLAGRLARWSLQVQEYDLTIVYKSGRLHNDADALSRHPVDGPEEMDVDYRVCAALPVEICPLLRHPAASSVMAGPGGISKPSLGECTVATILPTLATESLRANLKQAQRDIPLWRSHIERLEASNTKRSQNFELKRGCCANALNREISSFLEFVSLRGKFGPK